MPVTPQETRPATILVIEDEPQLRSFLRTSLAKLDHRVVEAETAARGEALAREEAPDVVLLDLGLPDADGVDVTRRMRKWLRAPILVISARGREQDKIDALDAGAEDYLTKPFGFGELMARIRVATALSSASSVTPAAAVSRPTWLAARTAS